MKLTCLMSVYTKDNPKFLKEAVESILAQTRLPEEFLIVEDGPVSLEIQNLLRDYETKHDFIRILSYPENHGLGYALKFGVEMAKGEIIARMDSDDISAPDRFEKELAYLESHQEVRLLGSNTNEFIGSIDNVISKRIMPESNEEIVSYSHGRNPFIHPSIMFYKEDCLKIGNYESWYLCEDYDLWVRFIENGYPCYNIQENLVFMRTSEDFYKRRGGLKYCKNIIRFKKHLRKKKYITFFQYLKTATASRIISLSPNFVRKFVYKKMLRK